MPYETTLLIFGVLLLLVGLLGKVRAKELEVGTESATARAIIGLVGVGLILMSFIAGELPISWEETPEPDDGNLVATEPPAGTPRGNQTGSAQPLPPPPSEVFETELQQSDRNCNLICMTEGATCLGAVRRSGQSVDCEFIGVRTNAGFELRSKSCTCRNN